MLCGVTMTDQWHQHVVVASGSLGVARLNKHVPGLVSSLLLTACLLALLPLLGATGEVDRGRMP
jgi:hypothetical protein